MKLNEITSICVEKTVKMATYVTWSLVQIGCGGMGPFNAFKFYRSGICQPIIIKTHLKLDHI
jgi:hypothetical protein